MRKMVLFLTAVIVVAVWPWYAVSQGFPGNSGSADAFAHSLPGNDFCAPYSAADRRLSGFWEMDLGWLEHPKGSTIVLKRPSTISTASWPLRGAWTGAFADVQLGDTWGMLFSRGAISTQRGAGTWTTTSSPNTYGFDVPGYETWFLEGLLSRRAGRPVRLLAGVRWDHSSMRLLYSDDTYDDYVLDGYIPVVGLQVSDPLLGVGLTMRCLVSPFVPGNFRYHYWDNRGYAEFGSFPFSKGYFLEFLGDYNRKVAGWITMGGFVRWNTLRAQTCEKELQGLSSDPVSWDLNKQVWIVGGTLSLIFSYSW